MCAYDYDVYHDCCPTRLVLERLADKWALLILDRLKHGPQRFTNLSISKVTPEYSGTRAA